jgi:hypothetical protein
MNLDHASFFFESCEREYNLYILMGTLYHYTEYRVHGPRKYLWSAWYSCKVRYLRLARALMTDNVSNNDHSCAQNLENFSLHCRRFNRRIDERKVTNKQWNRKALQLLHTCQSPASNSRERDWLCLYFPCIFAIPIFELKIPHNLFVTSALQSWTFNYH